MIKINKPKLAELLVLLIVVSSVIQFGIYRNALLFPFATMFALVAYFFLAGRKVVLYKEKILTPFTLLFLLILSSFFSSFKNHTLDPLLVYAYFSLAFFSIAILCWSASFNQRRFWLFLGMVFLIFNFLNFYFFGLSGYRYTGFFDNPNGMGRYSSIVAMISVLLIVYAVKESWRDSEKAVIALLLCSSIVLLLASNSRTSLISALFPLFFLSLAIFIKWILVSLIGPGFFAKKTTVKHSFLFFAFLVFGVIIILWNDLHYEVYEKFSTTLYAGDLTQGRLDRWRVAFGNLEWFGRGRGVYEQLMLGEVHSNYLSQALIFGIVPAFMFFSIFFYVTLIAFLNFLRDGELNGAGAFICISYFLIYSLAETGSAIFVVWLGFLFFFLMLRESKGKKRSTPCLYACDIQRN